MPKHNRWVAFVFSMGICFLYAPLGYLVIQAFLTSPDHWQSGFTLQWILKMLHEPRLLEPLQNSLAIGASAATLSTLLGTLGAVGFRDLPQKGHKQPFLVNALIVLPVVVPEVITGISLLLFFLFLKVPLGFATVVLAHASFSASFVYFVVREQLRRLDPLLAEAAADLGATPTQTFWKITFPNVIPGLLGGWLLAFTLSFDDFLISFFTCGARLTTLPLTIYAWMRIGGSPELNALSVLTLAASGVLVGLLLLTGQSRRWMLRSS